MSTDLPRVKSLLILRWVEKTLILFFYFFFFFPLPFNSELAGEGLWRDGEGGDSQAA